MEALKTKLGVLTLAVVLIALLCGCGGRDNDVFYINTTEKYLPNKAVVKERLGNDWIIFELDGKKFLFKEFRQGYSGYSALTQIVE